MRRRALRRISALTAASGDARSGASAPRLALCSCSTSVSPWCQCCRTTACWPGTSSRGGWTQALDSRCRSMVPGRRRTVLHLRHWSELPVPKNVKPRGGAPMSSRSSGSSAAAALASSCAWALSTAGLLAARAPPHHLLYARVVPVSHGAVLEHEACQRLGVRRGGLASGRSLAGLVGQRVLGKQPLRLRPLRHGTASATGGGRGAAGHRTRQTRRTASAEFTALARRSEGLRKTKYTNATALSHIVK